MRHLALTSIVALLVSGSVLAARETDPVLLRAQANVSAPPRVLALYYGWYGTPQVSRRWMHYENVDVSKRKIGSHVHYPANGPYDSTDPELLTQHVRQAEAAGINTLVCSWWGRKDQTDLSFRALAPVAERSKVSICPLYENVSRPGDPRSVLEDWGYLLQEYGSSPAFLRVDGKPVFFVYDRAWSQLTPEQWADVLASLQQSNSPGVTLIADGADLPRALIADGLFNLNPAPLYRRKQISDVPATFREACGPAVEKAKRFHRIPVVTISPGYDESRAAPEGVRLDRRDGEFYRLQWGEALNVPGAWILINSFNQWHSGTAVEPSVEFGDAYLRITRENSALTGRSRPGKK